MLAIFIGLCSVKFVIMAILYARERNWKGFFGGLVIALTGGLLAFLIGAGYMHVAKILVWIIAILIALFSVMLFRKKNNTIFVFAIILTALLVLIAHLL